MIVEPPSPTEIRIAFIILNCILIKFGTTWIEKLLLLILIISIAFLAFVVYRTQKYIWKIDMADKNARTIILSDLHISSDE